MLVNRPEVLGCQGNNGFVCDVGQGNCVFEVVVVNCIIIEYRDEDLRGHNFRSEVMTFVLMTFALPLGWLGTREPDGATQICQTIWK